MDSRALSTQVEANTMTAKESTVRYQLTVKAATGEKINELADRMNVSQSKMIEMLLETAIEDNEWLIKAVTHRWSKAIIDTLGKVGVGPAKGKAAKKRQEGMA